MKSRPFKVGVTIHPQQCTIQELRDAWRRADDLGVDSIWFWDHFFPLYGNPNGNHFECWSILAAAAIDTRAPQIGPMVTCAGYRNPDVLASIAATVDQLSGGRLVLGLGAGWFARDYAEYGFDFGEARDRVRLLKEVLPRITSQSRVYSFFLIHSISFLILQFLKTIADTAFGQNILRVCRVLFNFLPQIRNIQAQIVRFIAVFMSPHF